MRSTALLFALLATACQHHQETPLISAARIGEVKAIRALAAHGADPNQPAGVNGWTPLQHAVHKAQMDAMVALLDVGADPNRTDPQGATPLMMAAGYGYTDMVQVLLRRGADPRLRDRDGATALDLAITGVADIDRFTLFRCQTETLRVLQAAGAPAGSGGAVARIKRC